MCMIEPACEEGSRKEDDAKEKSKDKAKNPTKTHPCCWRWCCNTCNTYMGQGKDKNLENWAKKYGKLGKNLENWEKIWKIGTQIWKIGTKIWKIGTKNVETEVYLLLPPGCRIQEVQHLKPVETRSN